jgi:hypothetical protein
VLEGLMPDIIISTVVRVSSVHDERLTE